MTSKIKTSKFNMMLLLGCWGSAEAGELQEPEHACDRATFGLHIVELCPPYNYKNFPDERTIADKLLGRRYVAARISPYSDNCLAKMEEAMRAMEPFVIDPSASTLENMSIAGKRIKELNRAKDIWKSTKRDCWGNP